MPTNLTITWIRGIAFFNFVLIMNLAFMISAQAQTAYDESIEIHISAQPLGMAITQLATQTGILIGMDAELVADRQAPALSGRFTLMQAIGQLLKDSGLVAIETAPGRYVLRSAPSGQKAASQTDAVIMPEITVTETGGAYTTPVAFSATKTDRPLMETPVSVQVVPREVMQDQQATRIKDALENVSGIRPQSSLGLGNGFIIRGFRNDRVFRNGLVASGVSIGGGTEFDTANLQSVEVLKGPAAILFGRIEPGGMINLVTKRPEKNTHYALEQRLGSYNFYRTEWDATGPLTDDNVLSYRFAGSYQNNKSFRDFNFIDRVMVHPSVTWRPSNRTEMTWDVEALHQDYQVDRALFAIGDRPAPIPISRSFIDPDDPVDTLYRVNLGFNLTHALNDNWVIRNRFLATFNHDNNFSVKPANMFTAQQFLDPSAGNRTYLRNIFSQIAEAETYTTNLDLAGKFDTWGLNHDTLIGFDFLRSTGTYLTRGDFFNPVPGLEIDIFNPVYGIDRSFYANALATPFPAGSNHNYFRDQWFGVYIQDHITLWNKVHILAGGRYDWAQTGRGSGSTFGAARDAVPSRKDEGFSPRVGILYQPWNWLSIYGNWTTSFGANNGLTATGATIDPETGEQFEAGFKTQLFNQRLTTTVAYYHLTKENIMTRDFSNPDPFARAAIGKARSQGIELDMTGQITDEISLIGSYAYTDAVIIRDFSGLQGNRMNNVPKHAGSFWLKYDVRHYEPLNGLSLGVGVFTVAKRQGDDANTFILPGYTRLDAFAAYRMKINTSLLTAQITARNILDNRYYESTDPFLNAPPRAGIYPGAPLMITGSLRLEY